MITTITLNPCIDKTVHVASLIRGRTSVITESRRDIGGRGINVCVTLQNLGVSTVALCLAPRENKEELKRLLDELNVPCVPVTVPGRLRENLKIYDDFSGDLTEINESGSPVAEEALTNFLSFVSSALPKTSVLVIGGSVPPGTPKDIYARIIRIAQARNVPTVLDASGELLKEGLSAHPTLIKPNREDMERLCGRRIDSVQVAKEEAQKLVQQGIQMGLIVQKGCLPPAQTVAFLPAYVAGIMAVGAVPGHLEKIGRKTVFREKLYPSVRDLLRRLPERGNRGYIWSRSGRTALRQPLPEQAYGQGRGLLFQLLQVGNARISLHAPLFQLPAVPVPDAGIFDHYAVILFFF